MCGRRQDLTSSIAEPAPFARPAPVSVQNAGAQNVAAKLFIVAFALVFGVWFINGVMQAQAKQDCSKRVAQSALDSMNGEAFGDEEC